MEMYVSKEALKLTGPCISYALIGDSGREVRRIRCAQCGSPLVTEFDAAPSLICVKACSLDDPSELKPDFHVYVKSKQPWDRVEDGLPACPGDFCGDEPM